MCYSAQVWADYQRYVRTYQAELDIREFYELFVRRSQGQKTPLPKAMEAALLRGDLPDGVGMDEGAAIAELITGHQQQLAAELEEELFRQRRRLADAQRSLQQRLTKTAQESERIAGAKVEALKGRLADLRRSELLPRDHRIYPGHMVPVMVMEQGRRVIKPMRYQCRPAGKPADYDRQYPGTYNARRDNLTGFWRRQFGHQHGLVLMEAFYENVPAHKVEGRELAEGEAAQNRILEFRPRNLPGPGMLVACLWSRWTPPPRGPDAGLPPLLSFAAITDEPPPEVAAAGHDRCVIPVRPEHIDAWLAPDPADLARSQAVLDERERPVYAWALAA
ncbi:MAG: hypothetical protein RL722_2075 [Pseudomonadota bacterium]|jgi:putative SOS response-associated peptidase YedK